MELCRKFVTKDFDQYHLVKNCSATALLVTLPQKFCFVAKHFKSHVNYLLLFGKFRDARDPIDMTKLVCSTILDLN